MHRHATGKVEATHFDGLLFVLASGIPSKRSNKSVITLNSFHDGLLRLNSRATCEHIVPLSTLLYGKKGY